MEWEQEIRNRIRNESFDGPCHDLRACINEIDLLRRELKTALDDRQAALVLLSNLGGSHILTLDKKRVGDGLSPARF